MLLKRFTTTVLHKRLFGGSASTVDQKEIDHFQKFSSYWWDEGGPMKPLHSMNMLRVPFIRNGLINTGAIENKYIDTPKPLQGLTILDVGCGGGILTEPLARLGSNITGLDANPDMIEHAKSHAKSGNLNINYVSSSIEDHAKTNCGRYDVVVASEIIEHVSQKEVFIEACLECLKPRGSLFITTISKTYIASFLVIFVAENFLNIPKGTHEFEKFIEPHRIQRMLEDNNCKTELIHGMFYNPFTNSWSWCTDTSVNYALHGFKLSKQQ